ncbi:MAG: response regulator SirA [Candidatus Marinimicrobia bacterium]|nr:response regulator SirA [Candidatus Neomarinimicrobiota bacterium]MCF7850220.1 response regulator SirA [Candidatus Neomarinimicrobiota bacterium]MCF7903738.1 response regulator SirA [Candidatus Neomarinimicrobiota bacterium]
MSDRGNLTHVFKRDGTLVEYSRQRITNAIYRAAVAMGGRDKETAEKLALKVERVVCENYANEHPPMVEKIQDIVEKVLIEEGHAQVAKQFILYRASQHEKRKAKLSKSKVHSGNIPYQKIYEVLSWAADHNVNSVEKLNQRIAKGEFRDICLEADAAYEADVQAAAELIHERNGNIRIVVVAGPSSSGKTTTTRKLAQYLEKKGLGLVELNIDHYFFDLELHPVDEFGDYDFETPQALDLALINQHVKQLLRGEEVRIPYYDFASGTRTLEQTPMKISSNDIILIDSLHGLYGDMLAGIDGSSIFKVYIETLLQMKANNGKFIRWTDLRLMRRMIRDEQHRAYDPKQTLTHWHYVRNAELRNILPYVNMADYIINGAVPYELPVMRNRLFDHFKEWEAEFRDDPKRVDAYLRASRVRAMLEDISPVTDESPIPETSHFREFIGGSIYDVH